jgi:hypothetical protein
MSVSIPVFDAELVLECQNTLGEGERGDCFGFEDKV